MRIRFSPTLKRIVVLAVLLALATQFTLAYIGLSYMDSIDNSLQQKRSQDMMYQFQQNVLYQLNNIDNLMLVLQTPEFSDFYKNLMRLRDDSVVQAGEREMLAKFKALRLSSDSVQSIYFLGENFLQRSLLKKTDSDSFDELPRIDEDRLHYSKLDKLMLPDRDQLTLYRPEDFARYFSTNNPMLEPEDILELKGFMSDLQNRLIFSNGYENGVFILIVLDEQFLRKLLPANIPDNAYFSVTDSHGKLLWSTKPGDPLTAGNVNGKRAESYQNTTKELLPFRLNIVYSTKVNKSGLLRTYRADWMAGLAVFSLILTTILSYLYLKRVFKPFRKISKQIKSFTLNDDLLLRRLPEELIQGGFHAISMRNKLILVLIAAVSLSALSDGALYYWLSKRDIQQEMQASMKATGQSSAVSVLNRLEATESLLKQISVSQQFQQYVTSNNVQMTGLDSLESLNAMNLSMLPGLNDISYFTLLDENGNCLYSSIFSNNKQAFDTDKSYLFNTDNPYWITSYENVFSTLSLALVRRFGGESTGEPTTYLLIVPKESLFENLDSGVINTSYTISDVAGRTIFASRQNSEGAAPSVHHYESIIPNSGWRLSIGFIFNDVLEQEREYERQFIYSMSLALMLSVVAAIVLANIIVKPINRLKETMLQAGNGEMAQRLEEAGSTEIGGIIRSYNRMIDKLDLMMREENKLIGMKTRAELNMLQAQINPHFLYNTLEVINMRSLKSGNLDVSAIVNALADLFRYSIAKGSDIVPLDLELNHVANYVTIQQIRFGHSFEVVYDVPEAIRSLPIVRFVLQPIIENAIKHGFAGWEEGGLIVISGALNGDCLELRIADNGIGMDAETLSAVKAEFAREIGYKANPGDAPQSASASHQEDSGIGVNNVYQRLKLMYKERMSMTIDSKDMGGTVVSMKIPVAKS